MQLVTMLQPTSDTPCVPAQQPNAEYALLNPQKALLAHVNGVAVRSVSFDAYGRLENLAYSHYLQHSHRGTSHRCLAVEADRGRIEVLRLLLALLVQQLRHHWLSARES
jgi:hypothetical protein